MNWKQKAEQQKAEQEKAYVEFHDKAEIETLRADNVHLRSEIERLHEENIRLARDNGAIAARNMHLRSLLFRLEQRGLDLVLMPEDIQVLQEIREALKPK